MTTGEQSRKTDSIPQKIPKTPIETTPQKTENMNTATRLNLILSKEDALAEVEYFNDALEKCGFKIKTRAKFSKGDEFLDEYFCHFKHPDGLNFKLFGSGFEQLEFEIQLTKEGKISLFKYRFNQESFTQNIPLNLKGNKSYYYGEGFSGKSGSTSINIEN